MAKPARNKPKDRVPRKPPVQKVDERPLSRILPRSGERGNPNIPIRTVLYTEVGDLPGMQVQEVVAAILQSLPNEHPHYVVPMRHGKMTSEIEFEGEFLSTVKKLCEIKDGEIVLKGDPKELDVIRRKI